MDLSPRRLLHLMYHRIVDGGTEDARQGVDDLLARAAEAFAAEPWPALLGPAPGSFVTASPSGRRDRRPRIRGRAAIPGTATHGIRPPSWWKGDRAAWRSTVSAGAELGEPAAKPFVRNVPSVGRGGV